VTGVVSTTLDPGVVREAGRDPQAFETFYRGTVDHVIGFFARRVIDPHVVADLTADVYVAALSSAHTYSASRGSPRAWLFGIARHVLSGHRRADLVDRDRQRRVEGRRLLDEEDLDRMVERIDAQRSSRRLYAALAALPDGERAIFELVALDGLVPAEAAAVLGIRAATGRVRLHRARRTLRTQLADLDPAAAGRLTARFTETGEAL
jgi:RNA polymerase sigma-70 factor (ECF subfamily)